jgi:hypothetical protein
MLGIVLAVLASLPAQQDTTTLDAPVYANEAFGVSVPRPFDDWVFEPGEGPQTTTVIFHPRSVSLREQLWGALVLTTFPGQVPLRQVADRRVATTWRRLLGRGFRLLADDTLFVNGLPAVRTVMSGAIDHVVLEVEEYTIARGGDLIVLQLRYPRGLPRDSIAAGYRRVVGGLTIRGSPAPKPGETPVYADSVAAAGLLPHSPWQAVAYDALVRYDAERVRLDFAVRVDLENLSDSLAEWVAVWLWPALALDSIWSGSTGLAPGTAGSVSWVRLPGASRPRESTTITVFYHADPEGPPLPPESMGTSAAGAYAVTDWLPRVQPALDSARQATETTRARTTLRFDVPESWRAVAPGRLTAELASSGRRRMTWRADDVAAGVAAFALGPYRVVTRRPGNVAVTLWLTPDDSPSSAMVDSVAESVQAAWTFCSRAFGRLPIEEVNVATTDVPALHGFAGLLLARHAAGPTSPPPDFTFEPSGGRGPGVIVREIARTWWGNSVAPAGPASAWILEGLPAWAAVAARGVTEGDTVRQRLVREAETSWHAAAPGQDDPLSRVPITESGAGLLRTKGVAAVEAARRAVGEARFREALLSLAVEHRNARLTLNDVLTALGPDGAAVLRPYLF